MRVRGIYCLFLATALTILAGCGGGGGGGPVPPTPTPTQAVVKVRTSGTLPSGTTIAAIEAIATYPTTKGLSIAESGVVASGAGTGSLIAANVITTPGQVRLALISANGIQAGEFATLTFSIATGNSPLESDFAIASGATVNDINGNVITGMTVAVQSVAFQ